MSHECITSALEHDSDLSIAERHTLLASERRWLTLDVLASRGEEITLDELAQEVARRAHSTDEPPSPVVTRVTRLLHHVDLPKMEEVGVLSYDHEERRVDPQAIPEA